LPSNQSASVARGIVRVTGITSAGASTVFASTSGKVKISHIVTRPEGQVTGTTPLIVSYRAPSGTPIYASVFFGLNSATVTIPGFELPAGGMDVTSNLAGTPLATAEIFYFTSP